MTTVIRLRMTTISGPSVCKHRWTLNGPKYLKNSIRYEQQIWTKDFHVLKILLLFERTKFQTRKVWTETSHMYGTKFKCSISRIRKQFGRLHRRYSEHLFAGNFWNNWKLQTHHQCGAWFDWNNIMRYINQKQTVEIHK